MNLNEIYLGDSTEILKSFPNKSVNLIVTSPPYADKRAKQYETLSEEKYVEWFLGISAELQRVLTDDGSFVLNIKEGSKDGEKQLYVTDLVLALKRKQGWKFVEEYLWHKRNAVPGRWMYRFKDAWEHCYHFTKQIPFKMNQEAVMLPAQKVKTTLTEKDKTRQESKTNSGFGVKGENFLNREMVMPSNVLHFATEHKNTGHSAAYPIELPTFFIKLFTNEGDVVLDPFMGSGTTALACLELKRNYLGIEKKPEHLDIANNRIKEWKSTIQEPSSSLLSLQTDH